MAPRIVASLYFYFVKDLERDSFDLPVPMWWVKFLSFSKNEMMILHGNVIVLSISFFDTKQTVFRLDFKWNNNSFTVNSLHLQSIWGVMLHLLSRLPFEWRTLRTYLLVATMQCIVVTYLFHLMGGLITFGIGTFVFAVKATAEVGRGLKLLNPRLMCNIRWNAYVYLFTIMQYWKSWVFFGYLYGMSCNLNQSL